jgi:hypothetical protein
MKLLSRCQRIINAGLKRVVTSTTFTTRSEQTIYNLRENISNVIDVISIEVSDREIKNCSLTELSAYSLSWYRDTGSRFEFWSQIGKELIVIYPALATDSSVTVTYSKNTNKFESYEDDYNVDLELPDEDVDLLLGLSEAILLTKMRQFDVASERFDELKKDLTSELGHINL